jgi:hypothetical protein
VAADDRVLDHLGAEELIIDVTLPTHFQVKTVVGQNQNKLLLM